MEISIDIRIMAIPERKENDLALCQQLPMAKVFYDTNHNGNFLNARRTWLFPTDKTHVLVLQDDVELCDNFLNYVTKVINKYPDKIITYFSLNRDTLYDTPYIKILNKQTYGLAVSIPTKLINNIWTYKCDDFFNPVNADDLQIKNAALYYDIDVIQINPNLVQHKNFSSTCGNPQNRFSNIFINNTLQPINWDTNKIMELWE